MDPEGKPRESGEDSRTPNNELLGATAFDDLCASNETFKTLALRIREFRGLQGATMEVTILEEPVEIETINPKRRTSEQGASALVGAEG